MKVNISNLIVIVITTMIMINSSIYGCPKLFSDPAVLQYDLIKEVKNFKTEHHVALSRLTSNINNIYTNTNKQKSWDTINDILKNPRNAPDLISAFQGSDNDILNNLIIFLTNLSDPQDQISYRPWDAFFQWLRFQLTALSPNDSKAPIIRRLSTLIFTEPDHKDSRLNFAYTVLRSLVSDEFILEQHNTANSFKPALDDSVDLDSMFFHELLYTRFFLSPFLYDDKTIIDNTNYQVIDSIFKELIDFQEKKDSIIKGLASSYSFYIFNHINIFALFEGNDLDTLKHLNEFLTKLINSGVTLNHNDSVFKWLIECFKINRKNPDFQMLKANPSNEFFEISTQPFSYPELKNNISNFLSFRLIRLEQSIVRKIYLEFLRKNLSLLDDDNNQLIIEALMLEFYIRITQINKINGQKINRCKEIDIFIEKLYPIFCEMMNLSIANKDLKKIYSDHKPKLEPFIV